MTANAFFLAAPNGALVAIPIVAGAIIVGALIWIVWVGIGVRSREPDPPTREEQTHLPEGGAVREISERREPDVLPLDKQGGLNPYQLHGHLPNKRSEDQRRRRWTPGHSGSFGGGGGGAH
ncbi:MULTISPECIES: DUF6479 family protein [unclassified Streptomyces]|uniref:DUF6479 family protein n=1 Tax=unclassified Streptomyces TaxID=2593676 RepID=UPI003657B39E